MKTAGFVGTRFAGTDGVSLEVGKWAAVLGGLGYRSVYFSGLSDRDSADCLTVPQAFFDHQEIREVQRAAFAGSRRSRELTTEIRRLTELLKDGLYQFIAKFRPDVLIPQNALAIPMNIPLGVAITEVLLETGIPAIAHHHDFAWERERFRVNAVEDLLGAAFPPALPAVRHVVINREAQRQIGLRRGLSATVIPNVFDFAPPPPTPPPQQETENESPQWPPFPQQDQYNQDLRRELGIGEGQLLILQPTRLIARKGVEHALELAAQLHHRDPVFVIPHQELDEGDEYARRVMDYGRTLGVSMITRPDRIALERGTTQEGARIYSLWDLYVHADLVTYPSLYEGFGNAFVEAVYFGTPVFVNRYGVFREDIEPLGFRTVTMDGYLTSREVAEVDALLDDREKQQEWARENYRLAECHFSRRVLQERLCGELAALGLAASG
jgi:mannosylglucosylglycerate synthase